MTETPSSTSDLPIPANMPERAPPPLWWGPAMMVLGGMCIGFAPIGLKLSELGPQATALWRYVFALPFIFLLACRARGGWLPPKPPMAAILAGVFFGLDIGLWHAGLTFTSVANATFIVNLGNVGVGLAAWVFLREKPTWVWAGAALIAMTGAGLLSLGGQAEGGSGDIRGDVLSLAAALFVSGYMLFAKFARRTLDAFSVLFWMTLSEIVVAAALTAAMGEAFFPPTLQGFFWPLMLAIVAHVAGQGLIIAGLGLTPTAIAGLLLMVQPITAATIAWPLFGQHLTFIQIIGAALILIGIVLSQSRRRAAP